MPLRAAACCLLVLLASVTSALEAAVSDKAKEPADPLKSHARTSRLEFQCRGRTETPFYGLGTKELGLFVGQVSGFRKQSETETSSLQAKSDREGSRIRLLSEADRTVIDITSDFGIDTATITRKSAEWPRSIVVRLHLSGLESFSARSGNVAVEWSVASTGDHPVRRSLVSGLRVAAITKDSPYFSELRVVGGNGTIPLKEGYFEVPLPAKLFEGNPDKVTLRWIDFYRN